MDTTDKNIKKIFSDYTKNSGVDLEESIMGSIALEKNDMAELQQSRKRIKTGMILSALFLIGYFVVTYFEATPHANNSMKLVDMYLPTIFAALMIVVMYLLFLYGPTSSKKQTNNIVSPKM